jgi:hypothetical protein
MHCGKPLRAALAILPATPDPDLCPLCHQKSARVKTVFHESTDDLARELAPPRKPFTVRILGAAGEQTGDAVPRATARRRTTAPSFVASAAARGYTLVVWTLGGLAIVFLLLAMSKVGSYKELPSVVQHGGSLGAVISARVAASVPFLLGALGALAAASGLLAIRATVVKLWQGPVLAYRRAVKKWESAYYCPTDRIVFIRTVTAVRWDPVEELHRLLAQDGPGGAD